MKRAIDDCEFCGDAREITLHADDDASNIVCACLECDSKLKAGKVLTDIFDFYWWSDENGLHTAYKEDVKAFAARKAREDMLWQKKPVAYTGPQDTSA
ncbi:MAG: hypothetical protein ABIH04_05485 [Planctomycetota bacterium]